MKVRNSHQKQVADARQWIEKCGQIKVTHLLTGKNIYFEKCQFTSRRKRNYKKESIVFIIFAKYVLLT